MMEIYADAIWKRLQWGSSQARCEAGHDNDLNFMIEILKKLQQKIIIEL